MKSLSDVEPVPLRGGPVLRWGILAPGVIATKFARSLKRHTDQEIAAVGSRSSERAEAFGHEFSIPRVHGSYEALLGDDAVDDIVVVKEGTPTPTPASLTPNPGATPPPRRPAATLVPRRHRRRSQRYPSPLRTPSWTAHPSPRRPCFPVRPCQPKRPSRHRSP